MKKLSKMNNDERLNALRETALELQEICNFNPPFRSKGKTEEQVTVWLKEASPLLEPNDQKKISTETEDILYQLGLWPFNEDGKKIEDVEEVETVADNPDIIAEIEEASSVRQLKDIARTYDEFKGIRNSLTAYKKTDDLRVYMLEYLNPEVPEEVEEKKVEKKEVEEEPKTTSKPVPEKIKTVGVKSSYSKNQAMFDAIDGSKTGLTKKNWALKLDDLYTKKGGVSNPKGSKAHIDVVLPTLVLFGAVEETEVKGERIYKLVK